MKKGLTILLIALVAISSLFAQGQAESKATANGPVELTFWANYTTPERNEFYAKCIQEFEAENPNIKIKITCLPEKADTKLMAAYEAGEGPDIWYATAPDVSVHAANDFIIPLDKYFESWDFKDKILTSATDAVRELDLSGKNQLYYVPFGTAVSTIWVRSDWLKEVGYPDGIKTWEDFFDAAEKMTDKPNKKYGLSILGGGGSAKFYEREMYAYSGILSLFDENGKCTINDPKNIEFMERYLGLYGKCTAEGDLNQNWQELTAAFDSGSAGMIIHNLGSASDHVKAFNDDRTKFAAMGMPLNDKGYSLNMMSQPGGMSIAKTCKHPDEAWKFITFMATGSRVDGLDQLYGTIPVNTESLENSAWIHELPWCDAVANLLADPNTKFFKSYPMIPGKNKVYTEMQTLAQYVMSGKMTAKEMMDKWAEQFQACYDKYMTTK